MRKILVLLALAAMLALSAVVFGSPPTVKKKTFKNIQTVKIAKTIAADTSAVATRDAEARTVEATGTLNLNELAAKTAPVAVVKTDNAAIVNRHTAPPKRLRTGNAESRATNMETLYERSEAAPPSGYVLRR